MEPQLQIYGDSVSNTWNKVRFRLKKLFIHRASSLLKNARDAYF